MSALVVGAASTFTVETDSAPFASRLELVEVARFTTSPAKGGCTVSETVRVAPLASVPSANDARPLASDAGAGTALTNCAPAGRTSESETFSAASGPLLVTVIVHVAGRPARAEAGAVCVTARSESGGGTKTAESRTCVWLSESTGSPCAAKTCAYAGPLPASAGRTVTVAAVFAPLATSGRAIRTSPSLLEIAAGVEEMKSTLSGSCVSSTSPLAASGPAFAVVNVMVCVPPTVAGDGATVAVRPTSADCGDGAFTRTRAEAVLFSTLKSAASERALTPLA